MTAKLEAAVKAYDKFNPFLTRGDHKAALVAALSVSAAEVERRANELRVALEINTLCRIENTSLRQCIFCDVISASQTKFPHRQECICHDETA